MMKNRSGAGCFIVVEGKVLLLQRSERSSNPLTWCVPGGRIDGDETAHEAAVRETKEETNINLNGFPIPKSIEQPISDPEDKGTFTTFLYKFDPWWKISEFPVTIDHESVDWGWFNPKEMASLSLHPGMDLVLKKMKMKV